jgi:hypothetical protein
MSRHQYSDDSAPWDLICWRGQVASAIRGQRGQRLIREMRDALLAMPEKILIAEELVDEDGAVCGLGAVGLLRGIDMRGIDPEDEAIARAFDIAAPLAREIMYENDNYLSEQPEQRHARMLRWAEKHIISKDAAT